MHRNRVESGQILQIMHGATAGGITMKRPESHVIADEAVAILTGLLPSEWISRTIQKDYGLDLEVELVDGDEVTGARLWFQVKGTRRLKRIRSIPYSIHAARPSRPAQQPKECISFEIETKMLEYSLRCDFPVLLAVVDVRRNAAYWLPLRDHVEIVLDHQKPRWAEQQTVSLSIPLENSLVLDRECDWEGLRWYASEMARMRAFVILNVNQRFAECECKEINRIAESPEEVTIDERILARSIYIARTYLARTLATECLFGPRGVDFVEVMIEGQLRSALKASDTALTLLAGGDYEYRRLRVLMCCIEHGIRAMAECVFAYQAVKRRFLFSDERSMSFKKKGHLSGQ